MNRFTRPVVVMLLAGCVSVAAKDAVKGKHPVWMDPETVTKTNPDYVIQGEYAAPGLGAQVIALGDGHFQAVLFPDGLPGAGWKKEEKILLDGKRDGTKTVFVPATGQRKYLNAPPNAFSATSTFPPKGQKPYKAVIENDVLAVTTDDGKTIALKKSVRKSPTLGKKAPNGAVVLFDGKKTDELKGGTVTQWGWLHAGKDSFIMSKRAFKDYILHVEFMTCFSPHCRGQSRGNSGCFQANGEEVQVLDSFGLDGKPNEAGGIYKWRSSDVNMALPPLTWQTYDIEYVSGEGDQPPTMTVRHNGVVIHDRLKMKKPSRPGNIRFQQHKDWVQYRNLWVLAVKPDLDPTTDGK
jgi:hypothetical protein